MLLSIGRGRLSLSIGVRATGFLHRNAVPENDRWGGAQPNRSSPIEPMKGGASASCVRYRRVKVTTDRMNKIRVLSTVAQPTRPT